MDTFADLEKILGYPFSDKKLLRQALTHRSHSADNNERLEFLGDSILNFLIGEELYRNYPNEPEGGLSRLRSYVVKKQSLYEVGTSLSLSHFILLGQGELRSGGHARKSLIADCVEALIAAIFLDSKSLSQCRQCVLSWFTGHLDNLSHLEHLKDPKTRLQEYLQSRHLPLPTYEIVKVEGVGHDLSFNVECQTSLVKHKVTGIGQSRRKAEQDAAKTALSLLNESLTDCLPC